MKLPSGRTALILIIFVIIIGTVAFLNLNSGLVGYYIYGEPVETSVTRDLPGSYSVGQTFNVILRLVSDYNDPPNAVGIRETIPDGWNVTYVSRGGIVRDGAIEWLFAPGTYQWVTYTVFPTTGEGTFYGTWMTEDLEENEIGGDVHIVGGQGTEFTVSPGYATPGDTLTLDLQPGVDGAMGYIYIYYDNRYVTYVRMPCDSYKCMQDVSATFTIPNKWINGIYSFRLYDYTTRQYIKRDVSVNGSSVQDTVTTLEISPQALQNGDTLSISVTPGWLDCSRYMYFYKDKSYKGYKALSCSNYRCDSPVSDTYTIPSGWETGNYTAKVYDYWKGYIEQPFYVY